MNRQVSTPSDPKAAFRTHSNYFHAFHSITTITAGFTPFMFPTSRAILEGLHSRITQPTFYQRLKKRSTPDLDLLRRIMRNAWGTEFLLAATADLPDDELFGLANNWEVVQAYYAVYHAAQALTVARGQPRPDSHPKTLHAFSDYWVKPSIDLPPWTLGFQSGQPLGFPSVASPPGVTHWTPCTDKTCWAIAAISLRTTREDGLQERIHDERTSLRTNRRKQWEQQRLARGLSINKPPRRLAALPLVTPQRKLELDNGMHATTIMDYLARIRLRSNYEDPTMFTDGPDKPYQSRLVHRHLSDIATTTIFVHELLIRNLIGVTSFLQIVNEWLSAAAFQTDFGLAARHDLVAAP
jgi:hypothetical protein